jgi:hypothetical protein
MKLLKKDERICYCFGYTIADIESDASEVKNQNRKGSSDLV